MRCPMHKHLNLEVTKGQRNRHKRRREAANMCGGSVLRDWIFNGIYTLSSTTFEDTQGKIAGIYKSD